MVAREIRSRCVTKVFRFPPRTEDVKRFHKPVPYPGDDQERLTQFR